MNTQEFTYLLHKSKTINKQQTVALESILIDFPFFQSARALHLKGLFNQESFRYNYELKKTAANTFDRSILFDFITSNNFKTLPNSAIEKQTDVLQNITVNQAEIITATSSFREIKKDTTQENVKTIEIEQNLEIGKPLDFENNEKHSFNEWLQLTKSNPIIRQEQDNIPNKLDEKIELIDKFIENNPKISPVKETTPAPLNISKSAAEPTHLMTETLAKIYLEQKKYTRAIQAYEILILKYPEKSSFFADRIENIKKLQQNNS
ncbi:tetratricopeptide repeat protein [Flavobacterium sp.]|uniref:tetratricopeptide repeat protein n=1 Tax=Flavobacterium sp. TaxID=239 RepID=UPI003527A909